MTRLALLPFLFVSSALAADVSKHAGHYQGTLGDKLPITLTLEFGPENAAGQYRYTQYGSPIGLQKVRSSDHTLALDEFGSTRNTDKPTGQFRGTFDANHRFTGTWTSADAKRTLPFTLHRVAETSNCFDASTQFVIRSSFPLFTAKTPFHTALNANLAKRAAAYLKDTAKEYRSPTSDLNPDSMAHEFTRSVEILHADDSLVSILEYEYTFTGGAHGNHAYTSLVYTWRDNKLVELHPIDLLSPNSLTQLDTLLLQDLKRQKASQSNDVKSIKLNDLTMNPTPAGLLFTFAPYEVDCYAAGTYTVMIPLKSLTGLFPPTSPLARFTNQ